MTVPDIFDDIIALLNHRRGHGGSAVYLSPENRASLFAPASGVADGTEERPESGSGGSQPQVSANTAPMPSRGPKARAVPPGTRISEPDSPPVAGAGDVAGWGWADLEREVPRCTACPLHERRNHVVLGEGDHDADLMFIGEAPGYDEDQSGRPFVGKAGQLLTRMILAMQFTREDVYIANIIKCRPPGNRTPNEDEATVCLPYLKRQIALIQPKVIVLLGATPLRSLLGINGITREHGKWRDYQGIAVLPTFHPSYLLRSPQRKKEAWQDLQEAMRRLGRDPDETLRRMHQPDTPA